MTDKEKIKEQANIDISNLRMAQEQGIITEFGRGELEALEGIVDFIYSLQEEPVSKDFEMALAEMVAKAQICVVEPWAVAAQWKDELIKLAKSEEPVNRTPADVESAMQEVEEKSNAFTEAHQGEDTDTTLAQMRGEEPISNDLEEASKEWLRPQLDKSYANYGETKMMELTHFDGYAMLDAIEFGAKWKENNLWKPADGNDLPEIDREVVAFQETYPTDVDVPSLFKIVIAHRPNPDGWDGKSVTTGETEHYTPKTYDEGGWNIPDVKFWLDIDLPNMEE